MTEMKKLLRIHSVCPECGCGLIDKLTPDQWKEKYGPTAKEVEVDCPDCGKKHKAVVTEEE